MRRFELHRDHDETGISGTGAVAEGIEFTDGRAALRWRSEHKSTACYDSMADVEAIHGHGGLTRVVWLDRITHEGQCPAVAVLVDPFEAQQCWLDRGHEGKHHAADSAGTTMLWSRQVVHYPQCICGVGSAEAEVCVVHSGRWTERRR